MEKFLGVLFCGGKGTRLGEITKYISKSFVPVYDKPVFKYGLEMLERCKEIDEIVILTNEGNDNKLKQTGYKTIIQNDDFVHNMPTGWNYIKMITKTKKNAVLMPSDNISNINLDKLIELFQSERLDFTFSLFKQNDNRKLKESGCFDINTYKYYYKHANPPTKFITIAPYIINSNIKFNEEKELIENTNSSYCLHNGYWFDVGDYKSILEAKLFVQRNK